MRRREFSEVGQFVRSGWVSFFPFIWKRNIGSELIFDELLERFIISICPKLVPSALENSKDKVESNLTEAFEERNVFLPVILQFSITNKVGNAGEQNFNVIDINLLEGYLTKHGNGVSVAILRLGIAWLTKSVR